jgi:hypothetical protein
VTTYVEIDYHYLSWVGQRTMILAVVPSSLKCTMSVAPLAFSFELLGRNRHTTLMLFDIFRFRHRDGIECYRRVERCVSHNQGDYDFPSTKSTKGGKGQSLGERGLLFSRNQSRDGLLFQRCNHRRKVCRRWPAFSDSVRKYVALPSQFS